MKTEFVIFFEDSFDAAHYLPLVEDTHKCKKLHGHTYRVRIEVSGRLSTKGWVVDYADVKKFWLQIKNNLDHVCLNDFLQNPTCELIADYIWRKFENILVVHFPEVKLASVQLRETEHCGVTLRRHV